MRSAVRYTLLLVALAIFATTSAIVLTNLWTPIGMTWSNVALSLEAAVAAVAAFTASRAPNRVWQAMGLCFAGFAIAQANYAYQVSWGTGLSFMPAPSDVLFFVAFIPPIFVVLIRHRTVEHRLDWMRLLDLLQVGIVIVAAFLCTFYVPSLRPNGSVTTEHLRLQVSSVRDLALAAAFFTRARISHGSFRSAYVRMGSVLMSLGFILVIYANLQPEDYSRNIPEDLLWPFAFLLATALTVTWREDGLPELISTKARATDRLLSAQVLPVLFPIAVFNMLHSLVMEQITIAWTAMLASGIISAIRLTLSHRRHSRSEAALERSESRYRSLFERNQAGVFRCSVGGEILECNPAFLHILGFASREQLESEEFRMPIKRQVVALRNGSAFEHEMWIETKSTKVYVLQDLALVANIDGEFIDGTMIDVTKRRELETQLSNSQRMEAMGRFAGGIAHDFNNLLTVVKGFSELLRDRLTADHESSDHLHQIQQAADRAASLTRQLLAFSRKQVLQPALINLNDVLHNLDKMLRRIIGEDIDIVTRLSDDLGTVRADASQLEQVVLNIVINARDAMPNGGTLTISTSNVDLRDGESVPDPQLRPGSYVVLSISDEGTGIPPEIVAKIFEPFFTTKEPGRGTGLGLSTVYGIVKQSGGTVTVESQPDRGSTFRIYLPRLEENSECAAAPARASQVRGTETILVVEDEELLRELVERALRRAGFRPIMVSDSTQVEHTIRSSAERIHLVLTDVVMPKLNGRQVAKIAQRLIPGTPVLFMSGYTQDEKLLAGLINSDSEINFLQKPFAPAELVERVRAILDGRREASSPIGIATCTATKNRLLEAQ